MNDFVIILKNMLLPVLTVEKVTTETFEDFIDQISQKYYTKCSPLYPNRPVFNLRGYL